MPTRLVEGGQRTPVGLLADSRCPHQIGRDRDEVLFRLHLPARQPILIQQTVYQVYFNLIISLSYSWKNRFQTRESNFGPYVLTISDGYKYFSSMI